MKTKLEKIFKSYDGIEDYRYLKDGRIIVLLWKEGEAGEQYFDVYIVSHSGAKCILEGDDYIKAETTYLKYVA